MKKGFTLIELLVVIVIIGILATLATVGLNSVRAKARDAKRISDIRQVQSALELYLNENNSYPTTGQVQPGMPLTSPDGSKTYMSKVPGNPKPWAEGSCSSTGAEYSYVSNYNNTYQISYCLANSVNEINSGACTAIPGSICNRCISSCVGKYCGDNDGCGGKCTAVPIVGGSNPLICSSGQIYCGTTLVANVNKINQCNTNTANCSGSTCSGTDSCVSGVCKTPCTQDSNCGLCQKCVGNVCVNQTASEDTKNECGTTNCFNGNCNGSGACGVYSDNAAHNCDVSGNYSNRKCTGNSDGSCSCSPLCGSSYNKYCGDSDSCGGQCSDAISGFTCNASYQTYCGTTLVTDPKKVNQCSGNTASCSGATCSGTDICSSNTCKTPCLTDTDCALCKFCSSGFCYNQNQYMDNKNECSDMNCGGNCNGKGACAVYSLKYHSYTETGNWLGSTNPYCSGNTLYYYTYNTNIGTSCPYPIQQYSMTCNNCRNIVTNTIVGLSPDTCTGARRFTTTYECYQYDCE